MTTEPWQEKLKEALHAGTRIFIAAGGDGTLNQLLNGIMQHKNAIPLTEISIGAMGLGSSNDYHKPYTEKIDDVPVKINPSTTRDRDVILATYIDSQARVQKQYFMVSASIGLVAQANWFFNSKGKIFGLLKRCHTSSAILCAALKTIICFKPFRVRIRSEDIDKHMNITSLSILKTQYISGCFHLDAHISPDNGKYQCQNR